MNLSRTLAGVFAASAVGSAVAGGTYYYDYPPGPGGITIQDQAQQQNQQQQMQQQQTFNPVNTVNGGNSSSHVGNVSSGSHSSAQVGAITTGPSNAYNMLSITNPRPASTFAYAPSMMVGGTFNCMGGWSISGGLSGYNGAGSLGFGRNNSWNKDCAAHEVGMQDRRFDFGREMNMRASNDPVDRALAHNQALATSPAYRLATETLARNLQDAGATATAPKTLEAGQWHSLVGLPVVVNQPVPAAAPAPAPGPVFNNTVTAVPAAAVLPASATEPAPVAACTAAPATTRARNVAGGVIAGGKKGPCGQPK